MRNNLGHPVAGSYLTAPHDTSAGGIPAAAIRCQSGGYSPQSSQKDFCGGIPLVPGVVDMTTITKEELGR